MLEKLRVEFRRQRSQPVGRVITVINPILRGWVNSFGVGNSFECFAFVKQWVEKKVRRHLMRARKRPGFGWKRWSRAWIYETLGVFNGYRVSYGGGRELSLKVVDERDRRRTLLGKLSSQTPRPRCHPGERYATYVEGYHYEVGSSGG